MKKIIITSLAFGLVSTVSANMESGHHMDHSMPIVEKTMDHEMPKAEKMMQHTTPASVPVYMHHQNLNGKATPSAQAYTHINHTMHEGMNIEFSHNADIDFLKGMIPHHQGAVDMANVQLEHGKSGLLKHFTQRVIRDQEREIGIMNSLLHRLEKSSETDVDLSHVSTHEFKKVNEGMHMDMNIRYSGNADIDFLKGMIPHHKGAVDMAKVVVKHGQDANVRTLAYEIINSQEAEIAWMKKWLHRQRLMEMTRRVFN